MIALMVVIYAMQGHLPVVEYLCNENTNVNTTTNDGSTPLHVAAQFVSI